MSYTTFAEIKEKVRGPSILKTLLAGHAVDIANISDDGASHPFTEKQILIASGMINDALADAGLEWPIADTTDERLRLGATWIVIGLLAEAASNQEPWTKEIRALGNAYLAELRAGAATVIGSEPATDLGPSGVTGRRVDVPVFDIEDSVMDRLMPSLGPDPRWWR